MGLALAASIVFPAFGFLGCTTTDAARVDTGEMDAVICPKCETTWVYTRRQVGAVKRPPIKISSRRRAMVCPDCDAAATAYLQGGKLEEHACESCGGTLEHCVVHEN